MGILATSILCLLLAVSVYSRHTKFNGCSVEFDLKMEEKAPIFVKNSSKSQISLILPEKGSIRIKEGDDVLLACPGAKNSLIPSNSDESLASCQTRNMFLVASKKVSVEEALCKKTAKADISKLNMTCGNNGQMISIGYKILKNKWVNLINVCYNEPEGSTLYTQHYVYGDEIQYASKTKLRPGFSSAGLGPETPADVVYKQTFQKSTFNKLLGSARLAEQYINDKSYLARGHLSPDADFLLSTWQYSTYFYINTCPQWSSINNGNWKRIENLIRKTASMHGKTFSVITGTFEILRLSDSNNNLVGIKLSKNKIPVPKYVWKLVYDESTQEGIVLIVLNDPFLKKVGSQDLLCKDICEEHGWNDKNWKNINRGYVECCEFTDFSKKVKNVPRLNVKRILKGIN